MGERLECPLEVDGLTRTAQTSDGRSCQYQGPEDERIDLTLMALNGHAPNDALTGLQQDLRKESGLEESGGATANQVGAKDRDDQGSDHARIDLPGLHLDADNGKASVRLPGISVNANDDGAQINTGWGPYKNLQIEAQNGHAEIRGGDVSEAGAKLVYLIASDQPGPGGYHTVGYEARGPASGPLVVGVFKSRREQHDHHRLTSSGLDALIRLNVKD
ncbi:MAG: hypothetical protein WA840_21445 [Caulobacteraceae bacterium]